MAAINDWPWHHWRRRSPNAAAIFLANKTLTWAELAREIDHKSAEFSAQGVRAGEAVALIGDVRGNNGFDLLLAYLALLQLAACCLPLNPQLAAGTLPALLTRLGISRLIDLTHEVIRPEVVAQKATLSHQHAAVWSPARAATLTLTSGSNGLPKAAVHTLAAHIASAEGVVELMSFTHQHRWLLSLPLFHVSGQGIVWRWLSVGAGLVLSDGRPLAQALQCSTHASLVPTQLWRLLESSASAAGLCDVLLGGADIPPALIQRAERVGIRCWCGYGMTETASTVTAKRADDLPGVGNPLKGREVRIVNQEIQLRATSMALGYWLQGRLQPLNESGGWLRTRDGGEWQNGELNINGRLDNLFFSGGEGIQPEEVERILREHPRVNSVFIIPVDDTQYGQRPVAVIDGEEGPTLTELMDWARVKLAGFQRPIALFTLPEDLQRGGIKVSRRDVLHWVRAKYVNR
ncbi:o-succinylbenzoate--CoA ligase [Rouxiella silvae]|uniref:O-succinylbenzoate--CoA ligase n=1 Tax=Rouxiella silvae TaxID=1646373 RepID=A0ABX3TXW1_9GAMM|nr:o-succinylbenzoate--CoA ligase [Rouxiella silvae]ORJ20071.1 o-succinylbenzoate--CoA ligase [Rouxiella silvae]